MPFTVYILQSEVTFRYYVGHTQNFEQRFIEHNNGKSPSTHNGIPWPLVHSESFPTRSLAMQREMKIKKRGIARSLQDISNIG